MAGIVLRGKNDDADHVCETAVEGRFEYVFYS